MNGDQNTTTKATGVHVPLLPSIISLLLNLAELVLWFLKMKIGTISKKHSFNIRTWQR